MSELYKLSIPQLPYIPQNIWYEGEIENRNQKFISEKTLKRLEKILVKYRNIADKELKWQNFWYDTEYPIWHCWEIRDYVFNLLEKNVFLTNWENFKKIYWIQKSWYFHNAIQIWDTILDVANDTVEINDKKIIISKIKENLIENIKNYHDFCDIAEKYWWFKIIPNNYLDKTKNKYPFFFQRKDWVIFLPDFIDFINKKDEKNNFLLSKDFFQNNKYKNNTLAKEYINLIDNWQYIKSQETAPPINKEFYKLYLRNQKSKLNKIPN
jgi:hypothetical protein